MSNRRPAPASTPPIRRASLKDRVIALLLTIIGVVIGAIGMKQNPNSFSVLTGVGIAFVLVGIGFRLKNLFVKS